MSGALAAWRRLVFTGIPGELFGTFEAKKRLHTSSQKTLLNTIEAAAPMRVRQDVLDNSISDDAFWRLETLRFQGFVGKEQCDAWPDGTAKFEYFLTTVYLKWRQPKENGSSRKALLNVLKRGGAPDCY